MWYFQQNYEMEYKELDHLNIHYQSNLHILNILLDVSLIVSCCSIPC